jgi:hypothetical protein
MLPECSNNVELLLGYVLRRDLFSNNLEDHHVANCIIMHQSLHPVVIACMQIVIISPLERQWGLIIINFDTGHQLHCPYGTCQLLSSCRKQTNTS